MISSRIYEWIGRATVQLAWWKFGKQIRIAGIGLAALLAVGAWLISRREPPEG
ncbi:MAG TPA: hypothetical protein VIL04_07760 [Solirubrobacterales bacterium]|jgi:uncharacterized membrane protein